MLRLLSADHVDRPALPGGAAAASEAAAGPSTSSLSLTAVAMATSAPAPSTTPALAAAAAVKEVDGAYFDSYSGFEIHKQMISDKASIHPSYPFHAYNGGKDTSCMLRSVSTPVVCIQMLYS